jgi:uncharacterized damage-inducible protein DinB
MLATLRKLWAHLAWADETLLRALEAGMPSPDSVREYGHILGADEIWLARLEHRAPRISVWPSLTLDELRPMAVTVHEGYRAYFDTLNEEMLARVLAYTNTAGKSFENPVGDILLHVSLHAQYHRGKVNLLLRQAGLVPASTDYIVFIRSVAAPD